MNTYLAGQLVRFSATFTNDAGALTDPTTITLKVGNKALGLETIYTYGSGDLVIVRDSVGAYHADLDSTAYAGGIWSYEWIGRGAVQTVGEQSFSVAVPSLP